MTFSFLFYKWVTTVLGLSPNIRDFSLSHRDMEDMASLWNFQEVGAPHSLSPALSSSFWMGVLSGFYVGFSLMLHFHFISMSLCVMIVHFYLLMFHFKVYLFFISSIFCLEYISFFVWMILSYDSSVGLRWSMDVFAIFSFTREAKMLLFFFCDFSVNSKGFVLLLFHFLHLRSNFVLLVLPSSLFWIIWMLVCYGNMNMAMKVWLLFLWKSDNQLQSSGLVGLKLWASHCFLMF